MTRFTAYNSFVLVEGSKKLYRLGEDLHWHIGRKDSDWVLVIPSGYEADVSAPRGLHWSIDVHDFNVLAAAAIHDNLLDLGFDKAFASSEFRRALKARNISKGKAWGLFFATLFWTLAVSKK